MSFAVKVFINVKATLNRNKRTQPFSYVVINTITDIHETNSTFYLRINVNKYKAPHSKS